MTTFGIAEIKRVILKCKVDDCNHEQSFDPDKDIALPLQCTKCKAPWSRPGLSHTVRNDTDVHANFLYLIPTIREAVVPFQIRFEF
jgi:hypothetical protein